MNSRILNNVWYVLRKTWFNERTIILIIILQIIIGVLVPFLTISLSTIMLEAVMSNSKTNIHIFLLTGLIVIVAICNYVKSYISSVYETHLLNNKIHFLTDLFRKKMEVDYSFVESSIGHDKYQLALSTLLNDNQGISGMLQRIGSFVGNICSLVLYSGIILILDIRIVFVLLFISFFHLSTLKKILKSKDSKKEEYQVVDKKIDYIFRYVKEGKNNKDIKMFSMQNWLSSVTENLIKERVSWVRELAKYDMYAAVSDCILLIIRDGIAYLSIFHAVLAGKIDVSQFVFYFGAVTGFSVFMSSLTTSYAHIEQKSREVSDIRQYIELDADDFTEEKFEINTPETITVEFKNVSFRHENGPFILKNVNLNICEGERKALVGENGAGKTTLVKLICGLYKPTEGKILINGIDITELSSMDLRRIFAPVFQDIYILPMSISENINFESGNKDREAIAHCLKLAGLEQFCGNLNAPLTKMLHEDGIILSGGQEQRLAFARAAYKIIYQNAAALVLDEPTSALDALAEKKFYERYDLLARGKTTLFISHRLASTQFCDSIVVLDAGRVVEEGTHKQLLSYGGKYKELYDIQSQYYK